MQKEKLKTQKGITLIALIITIIVMLILVGVTVTVALKGGLFKTAKQAAEDTQTAVKQETEMLQYEYQTAKAKGETQGTFDEYVLDTKYNGLEIGDYVNYVEGTGHTYGLDRTKGFGVSVTGNESTGWEITEGTITSEDLGWRVLGVNGSGELELISDNPTNNKIVVKNIEGFNNYVQVLNEMCNSLYGKGNLAKSARSLNQDDIFKLTGYDLTAYSGYGDEYTVVKENDGVYINGVKSRDTDFKYYDKSSGNFVNLEVGDDPVTITSRILDPNNTGLTNNANLPEIDLSVLNPANSTSNGICLYANVYEGVKYGDCYFIVGGFLNFNSSYGTYINSGPDAGPAAYAQGNGTIYGIFNTSDSHKATIRPVVTLKSGITVTKNTTDHDGSTLAKACTISE